MLFYAPTGDAFKGKYVGETEANIVRLFRCASQKAAALEAELQGPRVLSVLFVDEIDSIARNREDAGAAAATVANATNTLLQMMDGIQSFDNVVVMGATNFPWNLDAAVLRRFGQKVYVPLPDEAGVRALLEHEVVRQLQTTLYARVEPTYFQAQRTVHECFERWAPLHGLDAEALAVLAREMTTTTKRAGYAPRDIKRMCDVAITREAQKASSDAFFLVRRRADKVDDDTSSVSSHASTRNHSRTTDAHEEVGMSLADELLRCLEGMHVYDDRSNDSRPLPATRSTPTYHPLCLGLPRGDTIAEATNRHHGKRSSLCASIVHHHQTGTPHVCQEYDHPTDYVLFRTTTVRVRLTTHTVPVCAWCTLGMAPKRVCYLLASTQPPSGLLDDTPLHRLVSPRGIA